MDNLEYYVLLPNMNNERDYKFNVFHSSRFFSCLMDLKDYKDGDFYILDNDHFSFVYNKRYETSQLFLYTHNEKYNWNANKENYYAACKLAKSLFLGEKK